MLSNLEHLSDEDRIRLRHEIDHGYQAENVIASYISLVFKFILNNYIHKRMWRTPIF
jgi:hypothetical protein